MGPGSATGEGPGTFHPGGENMNLELVITTIQGGNPSFLQ